MNERDNIIGWVTQVDMAFLKRTEPWNMFDKYEAFADLIRADEREKIIGEFVESGAVSKNGTIVTIIRARGQT